MPPGQAFDQIRAQRRVPGLQPLPGMRFHQRFPARRRRPDRDQRHQHARTERCDVQCVRAPNDHQKESFRPVPGMQRVSRMRQHTPARQGRQTGSFAAANRCGMPKVRRGRTDAAPWQIWPAVFWLQSLPQVRLPRERPGGSSELCARPGATPSSSTGPPRLLRGERKQ